MSNNAPIWYTTVEGITEPARTLIDSGSSRNFLNSTFAKTHHIPLTELSCPRSVIAIDGKEVKDKIRHKASLTVTVDGKTFKQRFYVMPLGDVDAILGMTWLREADPDISWTDLSISYKPLPIQGKGASIPGIPKEFQEYATVFSKELFQKLPPHREGFDCEINLKEDAVLPPPARPFPMSDSNSLKFAEELRGMLGAGKLQPSSSRVAAGVFYVPKADGGSRLVVDYRKINDITKSDQFPLPSQIDLIEKVREARIFSKLDLRQGFNNIRIKKGDEWKTAFRNKNDFYEYTVMPFGLKNAPAVFQRFMNHVLRELIDVCVVVYLDDILIYSKNREEHTQHVQKVLKILQDNDLFLKLSKCSFYVTSVTYIGIVITPQGVSMEKEKVKAVTEWKEPRKIKELQAFLGFANFYRRWIKDFSSLAKPLTTLTGKDVPWQWGSTLR